MQGGQELRFSADTLLFDTVFVALGSATYKIKIYNEQSHAVQINSIRLEKGNNSSFKLNVNGFSGNEVKEQTLAAGDSLYVFSTVTIDPNASLAPFVVEDRLIATLGDKEYSVPVVAYGQNARYIYDSVLTTQTWDNVLPYVIINNALVDKGQTLTLEAGCRVYVHPNSRLFVDGTLKVNGTQKDSVVFQSDRIDRSYFSYLDLAGEWGGLYFTENSSGNDLNWMIIKNAGASTVIGNSLVQAAALQVDRNSSVLNPEDGLKINHCIIQNSIGYGLFIYGGKLQMRNSLIQTCGAQNVGVFVGGDLDFAQCTFATYGTKWVNHSEAPVMTLLNYLDTSQTAYISGDLKARIHNCIIYGSLENELFCNSKGTGAFDVQLSQCLIKAKLQHPLVQYIACKWNEDPQFENIEQWNYRLKNSSPALGAGAVPFYYPNLDNQSGGTNIGAY